MKKVLVSAWSWVFKREIYKRTEDTGKLWNGNKFEMAKGQVEGEYVCI